MIDKMLVFLTFIERCLLLTCYSGCHTVCMNHICCNSIFWIGLFFCWALHLLCSGRLIIDLNRCTDGFLVQVNVPSDVALLLLILPVCLSGHKCVFHVSVCRFDSHQAPQSLVLHQLQLSLQILLVYFFFCSWVWTFCYTDETSCRWHNIFSCTDTKQLQRDTKQQKLQREQDYRDTKQNYTSSYNMTENYRRYKTTIEIHNEIQNKHKETKEYHKDTQSNEKTQNNHKDRNKSSGKPQREHNRHKKRCNMKPKATTKTTQQRRDIKQLQRDTQQQKRYKRQLHRDTSAVQTHANRW